MTRNFTFKRVAQAWIVLPILCLLALPFSSNAQRRMDKLGRGVVAVHQSAGNVFLSWRLLATDPEGIAFNVYRISGGGTEVKLNSTPLTQGTNFSNTGVDMTKSNTWFVKPVINNVEQAASASYTLAANAVVKPYIGIPLKVLTDGEYYVHHAWPGDLDGNGDYDFVVDRLPTGNPTGRTIKLDGYSIDGALKWEVDLGPNTVISDGHNDGATVYDLDGDGKAEVIVRTSEGTVFGDGQVIGDANNDGKTDYRVNGAATGQPQFISVINGDTGAEISRIECKGTGHFGIGYFDGVHPSFLFSRVVPVNNGSEHRVTTFNYVNKTLQTRWDWLWDGAKYQFFHQIRIADVDKDGKDEFCDGGYVIDDDGKTLFTTELRHGDRFHISDFDTDRPGLETFAIQQDNPNFLATVLYDSKTGDMLRRDYLPYPTDIGRGDAGDIDPQHKGMEYWTANGDLGTKNSIGDQIYPAKPSICNSAIWWDGDLLRETLNRQMVDKWNYTSKNMSRLLTAYNWGADYTWRDAAPLYGDFIGDWREEILYEAGDHSQLLLFTTTTPSTNRIYCLMQNPEYRLCATVRGYIQSNQVDYFLGDGMLTPPKPPVFDGDLIWKGNAQNNTWDIENTASWQDQSESSPLTFSNNKKVLFDISGTNTVAVNLTTTLNPASVTVNSPVNYEFSGSGSLSGDMSLTKSGTGKLTVSTNNNFTGETSISEGALILNGILSESAVKVQSNATLSGAGSAEKGVSLATKGNISPGNGIGSAASLKIKNGLYLGNASAVYLDLGSDISGINKPNDQVQIEGDLTISGSLRFIINPLEPLSAGNYTLISYTGTLTGNLSLITVEGLDGTPYVLSAEPGTISITVQSVRTPSSIVWSGSVGTAWDVAKTQNWKLGESNDVFVGGDQVLFDDNAVNTAVTLNGTLPVSSFSINSSKNYTFTGTGVISGSTGLVKSGSGTLSLQTKNTFAGGVTINGGTIEISKLSNGEEVGPLGVSNKSASNLVFSNGGILKINSTLTQNTDRGITLSTGGGEVNVANSMASFGGLITGSGNLVKSGTGIFAVLGKNTYTGGTTIKAGAVQLSSFDANEFGLGTGMVTLENGASLSMLDTWDGDFDYVNTTCPLNLFVPAGATGRFNAAGRCKLTGSLTGAGTFELFTEFVRTELNGNWSQFTGTIKVLTDADGGDFRINTSAGFGKATLNLGDKTFAYYLPAPSSSGTTLEAGAITGAAGSILRGSSISGRTLTWKVGGINTDAVYPGTIAEAGTGSTLVINKVGTGTWTISGNNTYRGNTIVTAGKLLVNNTAGSGTGTGSVIVAANAILGGTGILSSTVGLSQGAMIDPGNNGIGTFTVGGSLFITTSSKVLAEINPSNSTADRLNVAATLTYGGTLQLSKLGAGEFAAGNNFKLFNATTYAGSFASIIPEKPADGLKWDISELLTTGTLKVAEDPLPITLSEFSAESKSGSVLVKWTTESEVDNDFFSIEHSSDKLGFVSIATVKSKGNRLGKLNYEYPHLNFVNGVNYYRLKQTDLDGKYTYSVVRSVKMELNEPAFSVFPNPFSTSLTINLKDQSVLNVNVTNLSGKNVFHFEGPVQAVNKALESVLPSIVSGSYLLTVKSGSVNYQSKIVKQ